MTAMVETRPVLRPEKTKSPIILTRAERMRPYDQIPDDDRAIEKNDEYWLYRSFELLRATRPNSLALHAGTPARPRDFPKPRGECRHNSEEASGA